MSLFSRFLSLSLPPSQFPFDNNQLAVRFNGSKLRDGRVATCKDLVIHAGMKPEFIPGLEKEAPFLLWSDRLEELLHEYELIGVAFSEYEKSNCSFISWSICVRRRAWYYVVQLMAPLWITVVVTFPVFFSPPNDMSSKIEVLIGAFAAVIAFLFVIGDKLPKTPYRHKVCLIA